MTKIIDGYRVAKGDEERWEARQHEPKTTTVGVTSDLEERVARLEDAVAKLTADVPAQAETGDGSGDGNNEPEKRPTTRKVETK